MALTRTLCSALLALALLVAASACELAEGLKDGVVTAHRAESRGRVGTLRAMETHSRAASLCQSVAQRSHEACPLYPPGPMALRQRIKAELRRSGEGGALLASLEETRHLRRDAHGTLDVTWEASFTDPSGRAGSWKRREILNKDKHFVAEENLPFTVRAARPTSAAELLGRATDALSTGLALPGEAWRREGEQWRAEGRGEGEGLRCGLPPKAESWLRRLGQVSSVESAVAELGAQKRRVAATLSSASAEGELVLRLDIEEEILQARPEDIAAPERVASAQRDRPYRDLQRILGDRLGLSQWRP